MLAASTLCNVAYNALRRPKKERRSHKGAAFGLAESELLTHARNSSESRAPGVTIGIVDLRRMRENEIERRERERERKRGPMNLPRVLRARFVFTCRLHTS